MGVWISTLVSVVIVSLISLIGIVSLLLSKEFFSKIIFFLVSLSAGTLFGDAFIHLLPEASETIGVGLQLSLTLIGGILFFYMLENLVHWRHCHIPTSHHHPHPVGMMNLVGEAFHNFIDGTVIAAGFIASPQIGIATTIAVIMHEIPQEMGDFGVLVHAGYTRSKALFYNFICALTAVLGAVVVLIIGNIGNLSNYLLAFTAGGFIYIAGSDLIPELKKECYHMKQILLQFFWVLVGIGLMIALVYFG